MIPLHIELQDGWDGQSVEVRLDGDLLAALQPRTRYQIGLAHAQHVDTEPGIHTLVVSVTDGPEAEQSVALEAATWVGVSLEGDALVFHVQPTPFLRM